MTPTILIADDEEAPRAQLLAALGTHWPQARVVAVTESGFDAWDSFLEHEPQVCFLDIRMPGLSGIEVARRIADTELACAVVFCTAHNDHATQAFDAGAVDYLLKPLEAARFAQTLRRVQQLLSSEPHIGPASQLRELATLSPKPPVRRTLQASVGREIRLIRTEDVIYFESDARYTRIVYAQDGRDWDAHVRVALKELVGQLDDAQFWQVHRSVIVNVTHIQSAVRVDDNNMHLTLRHRAQTLPVSRAFQPRFRGE